MQPPRVKVYGLFPRTRRRYLVEAAAGAGFGLALLAAWFFGWPELRQRLTALDLPPLLRLTVAVLDRAPWLLLAALVYKAVEVVLVLRAFSRKESRPDTKETIPPTNPG